MVRRSPQPEITFVDDQQQLATAFAACRSAGRFGYDTEFVMEDRFEPEVCLIQLATEDRVFIVDPLRGLDVSSIWDLVCDPQIETVVHAGVEDLAFCVQHLGRPARRIYDVQIAAGLAGFDYPLSLQKLVQQALHIRLHKGKTLTDWRRRPLSEAQIRYGAEDVCHLLRVRQTLQERLTHRDRLEWAREEFARFEEIALYDRPEEDRLFRVKGIGALKGQPLAVVRELLGWREGLAERRNRPARVVLKDHLLVEIAKLGLSSYQEISDFRGLNLGERDIRELCGVVKNALEQPSDLWPKPKPRDSETPREAALLALATAVIRGYCLEHDIAYGLAASKKSIKELIRHCANSQSEYANDVSLLTGWRGGTIGAILQNVLLGRSSVRVAANSGDGSLHITTSEPDSPN